MDDATRTARHRTDQLDLGGCSQLVTCCQGAQVQSVTCGCGLGSMDDAARTARPLVRTSSTMASEGREHITDGVAAK